MAPKTFCGPQVMVKVMVSTPGDCYGFRIFFYNFQPILIIPFAFSSQSDGLAFCCSEFSISISDQTKMAPPESWQIFFLEIPKSSGRHFVLGQKFKILSNKLLVHPIVKRMQKELSKSVENCRRRSKNRKGLPRILTLTLTLTLGPQKFFFAIFGLH